MNWSTERLTPEDRQRLIDLAHARLAHARRAAHGVDIPFCMTVAQAEYLAQLTQDSLRRDLEALGAPQPR